MPPVALEVIANCVWRECDVSSDDIFYSDPVYIVAFVVLVMLIRLVAPNKWSGALSDSASFEDGGMGGDGDDN